MSNNERFGPGGAVYIDERRIAKTMIRRAGEIKSRALSYPDLQWHIARYRGDVSADSMPEQDGLIELRHVCAMLGLRDEDVQHLMLHDRLPYRVVDGDIFFSYFETLDFWESRDRRRLRYLHIDHDEPHPHCERCKKEAAE